MKTIINQIYELGLNRPELYDETLKCVYDWALEQVEDWR